MTDKKEPIEGKNILSNYAFTLNNIKNNIFRLKKNESGEIIYLLNEGPIPKKFGLTTEVIFGKTVEEIFGKEASRPALEHFEKAFDGEVVQYEVNFNDVWFETILSPVEIEGKVVEVAGSSYDITARVEYQKEIERLNRDLHQLSIMDKLTGLYNRYKLDEILKYEMLQSKRYGKKLTVIFFDLDNFKHINDKYGHKTGDIVLKSVSDLCQGLIRDTDSIGRWGGEEFMAIYPETSLNEGIHIAERIRKEIDSHTFEKNISITASFGVGSYKPVIDFDDFVRALDDSMYTAKRNGRNRVEYFEF
ncbi:MAG TPA: diguanylate cyclase [Clostridia bacterium]|nr:diguanylate cyclase [Clostridia bacterium]